MCPSGLTRPNRPTMTGESADGADAAPLLFLTLLFLPLLLLLLFISPFRDSRIPGRWRRGDQSVAAAGAVAPSRPRSGLQPFYPFNPNHCRPGQRGVHPCTDPRLSCRDRTAEEAATSNLMTPPGRAHTPRAAWRTGSVGAGPSGFAWQAHKHRAPARPQDLIPPVPPPGGADCPALIAQV